MPTRPPRHGQQQRPAGAAPVARHEPPRLTAAQRGYGGRWQRYRLVYLREHPLCVECEAEGLITPATVVDHVKPHKGDPRLFWDPENHQALCKPCHDRKTATDDGGFGRATNEAQGLSGV